MLPLSACPGWRISSSLCSRPGWQNKRALTLNFDQSGIYMMFWNVETDIFLSISIVPMPCRDYPPGHIEETANFYIFIINAILWFVTAILRVRNLTKQYNHFTAGHFFWNKRKWGYQPARAQWSGKDHNYPDASHSCCSPQWRYWNFQGKSSRASRRTAFYDELYCFLRS